MKERHCERCGARTRERKATRARPYQYRLSGLENLYLVGIQVRMCPKCGAEVPIIPKLGELHESIARAFLEKSSRLTGGELRFLRKNAGIAAAEFAALVGVDPTHLSRFENGHTEKLGSSTDKLARAVVSLAMGLPKELRAILTDVAKKLEPKRATNVRPTFKLEREHWRAA